MACTACNCICKTDIENKSIFKRLDYIDKFIKEFSKIALSEIKETQEQYIEFLKRIKSIEDFIDQNYKVDHSDHDERIHDLERIGAGMRLHTLETNMQKKIKELETEINTVRALGSKAFYPEKPHKCPVCEGMGKDKNPLVMGEITSPSTIYMKNPDCYVCNGKGIVWMREDI